MFFLKEIYVSDLGDGTTVKSGIVVEKRLNDFEAINNFWGKSKIVFGENVDLSKFATIANHNRALLPYASKIVIEETTSFGFKNIHFIVNEHESNDVDGYVIFVDNSYTDIQTTGEIIYMRDEKQAIVILREGNTLQFDGRIVEVINNKLMLNI